jgi:hypothetical protein
VVAQPSGCESKRNLNSHLEWSMPSNSHSAPIKPISAMIVRRGSVVHNLMSAAVALAPKLRPQQPTLSRTNQAPRSVSNDRELGNLLRFIRLKAGIICRILGMNSQLRPHCSFVVTRQCVLSNPKETRRDDRRLVAKAFLHLSHCCNATGTLRL